MMAEFAPHFELEILFRTLFLAAVFALTLCDVSNVAECSVKINSQVYWGWNVLKFFGRITRCSAFGWLLCFGYEIRMSVSFWVGTQVVSIIIFAYAI